MDISKITNKIPPAFMKVVKDISKLIWQNERCLYSSEDIASVVVGASLQNKSIEYTANAPMEIRYSRDLNGLLLSMTLENM